MQSITLSVDNHCYLITLASGLFNNLNTLKLLDNDQQALVITNQTVAPLYLDKICAQLSMNGARVDRLVLPDGEQHKTWAVLEQIFNTLLEQQHGRDTTLLALGGGVIGDLTGFAAACYQRGVRYLQLPTTLLAQADAAIGGKTAINHPLGKNMIGAFHQPAAVLIDIDTLSTLPPRHLAAGLAEVIKYGMVLDESFFCWLEQHLEAILQLQPPVLMTAIRRCCELKTAVVSLDERDNGQRLLLNFGHTFAHAIEAHSGYGGSWLHGEAVSVGMVMAALTAERLGLIKASAVERLQALLQRAKLPIVGPSSMQFESYWPYLSRDKKVSGGQLRLVLPTAVGHALVVGQPFIEQVDTQTLRTVITACC